MTPHSLVCEVWRIHKRIGKLSYLTKYPDIRMNDNVYAFYVSFVKKWSDFRYSQF